jgi:hypothetical protein
MATVDQVRHMAAGGSMSKLHRLSEDTLVFHCPGCACSHGVRVSRTGPNPLETEGCWGWNGSIDLPTITPSILCNKHDPSMRCHSFVRDGKIQFLNDCFHKLAGHTVEIPEWE